MNNTLFLSDDFIFYTLEGEGIYVGWPSVFMRLSMCNLTCIGFKSPDAPFGCDSFVSWSKKNKMTFEEIAKYMEERGFDKHLRNGAVLKLTGGEPLIQQQSLLKFCDFIHSRWDFCDFNNPMTCFDLKKPSLRIDFETNGTILPDMMWTESGKWICTFTVSPKLKSNGDPENKRFKPDVLKDLVDKNTCFKFVVNDESDLNEIFEKYINNPDINLSQDMVWLMPMCGSREELVERGPKLAELCKKHNFKFSNRLHLQLWNKALRV